MFAKLRETLIRAIFGREAKERETSGMGRWWLGPFLIFKIRTTVKNLMRTMGARVYMRVRYNEREVAKTVDV